MLTEAVLDGSQAMRDPVGGSVEFHFVPILKLINTLLIMGIFNDEDTKHILKMIDPNVFSGKEEDEEKEKAEEGGAAEGEGGEAKEEETEEGAEEELEDEGVGDEDEDEELKNLAKGDDEEEGAEPKEEGEEEAEGKATEGKVDGEKVEEEKEAEAVEAEVKDEEEGLEEGLLQMKLPESVKLQVNIINQHLMLLVCRHVNSVLNLEMSIFFICLSQMCTLLQYFCDCELRHRVEAIVAYSDQFVHNIQNNQRIRYNLLMRAFTMSAAETARKTREFRSPPQDQVLIIIIGSVQFRRRYLFPREQFSSSSHQAWPNIYCLF